MTKVLISGGSGLVGTHLTKLLQNKGYSVSHLTTRKNRVGDKDGVNIFYWNPAKNEIDINALDGVEVIINLAGANISGRWTSSYKKEIVNSRADSANTLLKALKENTQSVKHFIAASAIGFYGSHPNNEFVEADTAGKGFLADVVRVWEEANLQVKALDIPLATLRIGVVLDSNDGALPQLAKPVRYGLGAPVGNGKQYLAWIHIDDICGMLLHLLEHKLQGVYNGVGPYSVTNKDMTKEIATVLNKPLWLPNVPAFLLKLGLGEQAQLALMSTRVSSKKIEASGYQFKYPDLNKALKDLL